MLAVSDSKTVADVCLEMNIELFCFTSSAFKNPRIPRVCLATRNNNIFLPCKLLSD